MNENERIIDVELTRRNINGFRTLFAAAVMAVAGVVLSGVFAGCNTQGCTDNRSALPMMGFYSMSTKSQIILDSLELGGIGAPGDSLLLAKGQSRGWVYLPFRYDSGKTSFMFHYAYPGLDSEELDDVVTFSYTAEPYFASEECGAFYVYTITGVEYTRHLIDSIGVSDSVITNVDMERIQVYFRTIEPDEPEEGDKDDVDNEGEEVES